MVTFLGNFTIAIDIVGFQKSVILRREIADGNVFENFTMAIDIVGSKIRYIEERNC